MLGLSYLRIFFFCLNEPFFLVASPPLLVVSAFLCLAADALHPLEPELWLFLSVKIKNKSVCVLLKL